MKIIIAGGHSAADYLIPLLMEKGHEIVVINDDKKYCEHLAGKFDIPVVFGEPYKEYVLEDADIHGSDVMISLSDSDADNFAVCQLAKRVFGVRKNICTVCNPKNVEVFKKLGINTAISDAYILAKIIEKAADPETLSGDIVKRILED